jgi:hypothetical protein
VIATCRCVPSGFMPSTMPDGAALLAGGRSCHPDGSQLA